MADVNHDRFGDLAPLFAIGALPADERAAFEAHLRECTACAEEVRALTPVAGALPYALPQVDPPLALRSRVLGVSGSRVRAADREKDSRPRFAWLSAAALLLVAIGLGVYAMATRQRLARVELQLQSALASLSQSDARLAAALQQSAGVQARLAVLTASDLTQVNLAGQPPAPGATGRAFFSRSRGLVFAASNLPALPSGRTYQLWYLTPGAPRSAGLFKPDASGRAILTLDPPASTSPPSGLAVSIEPDGGVPAPTGAIYLAGLSH